MAICSIASIVYSIASIRSQRVPCSVPSRPPMCTRRTRRHTSACVCLCVCMCACVSALCAFVCVCERDVCVCVHACHTYVLLGCIMHAFCSLTVSLHDQACRATGRLSMSLWAPIRRTCETWRCDTQEIEGINNIIQVRPGAGSAHQSLSCSLVRLGDSCHSECWCRPPPSFREWRIVSSGSFDSIAPFRCHVHTCWAS